MMQIMVKLHSGYGDGYGIVQADDDGQPIVNNGQKVTRYHEGSRMEEWKIRLLAQKTVTIDGRVKVPVGAIERIIGPIDCHEALKVRARRYINNPNDPLGDLLIDAATEQELREVFCETDTYDATYEAFGRLWEKYLPQIRLARATEAAS